MIHIVLMWQRPVLYHLPKFWIRHRHGFKSPKSQGWIACVAYHDSIASVSQTALPGAGRVKGSKALHSRPLSHAPALPKTRGIGQSEEHA